MINVDCENTPFNTAVHSVKCSLYIKHCTVKCAALALYLYLTGKSYEEMLAEKPEEL